MVAIRTKTGRHSIVHRKTYRWSGTVCNILKSLESEKVTYLNAIYAIFMDQGMVGDSIKKEYNIEK